MIDHSGETASPKRQRQIAAGGWSAGFSLMISVSLSLLTGFGSAQTSSDPHRIFTAKQWKHLDQSVDRGIKWLSIQQNENGSIGDAASSAQPALTSLATMALLSRGHQPGRGPHGQKINRAIDYVLSTQDRYGFFSTSPTYQNHGVTYCHAISGVMLAEVLGMTDQKRNERIAVQLRRALTATTRLTQRHHEKPLERGGWRYVERERGSDADLSVSTWHILFLRAAKNAGYDVPESLVTDAFRFVKRCFRSSEGRFTYLPQRSNGSITMTGAGVLCLFLVGKYDDPAVKIAVRTLRDVDFSNLDSMRWPYYTCYHCSQVASQVNSNAGITILQGITSYLLNEQSENGSWPAVGSARFAGETYSTSMAILSLTPTYQILPIYQQ